MERGDWLVTEEGGLFKQSWFRYYGRRGEHFVLFYTIDGRDPKIVSNQSFTTFLTVDTASKEKTTADYTVIATWATDGVSLMLLDVLREKMEVPKILPAIITEYRRFLAEFVIIEDKSSGIGVIQEARTARGQGITVKGFDPGDRDKVSRSTVAQIRMEAEQVFFPQGNPKWLEIFMAELLSFPVAEYDDQVDTLSMAAWWVANEHEMRTAFSQLPMEVSASPFGGR